MVTMAPPPAYVQTFETVREWLVEDRGLTFWVNPSTAVTKFDAMETAVGRVTPLAVALPDGRVLMNAATADHSRNPFTVGLTLHELLHESVTGGASRGGYADVANTEQALAAEQATETLAADFLPRLLVEGFGMKRSEAGFWTAWYVRDSAYRHLVVWERRWSAQLCGCKWTSPRAAAIRFSWFMRNASDRHVVGRPKEA